MVLTDKVPADRMVLPPDNLSLEQRLNRLFSGIENRWRMLAILSMGSVASDLVKPEIVALARNHGPKGLAIRVCFAQYQSMNALENELLLWNDEHIVATGDSIHACRFLKGDPTPRILLFSPDNHITMDMIGFDNMKGLDDVDAVLTGKKSKNH